MTSSEARAALLSEEPATAFVDLPLALEYSEGKEFVRDSDGRPQGVIERKFCEVSWDHSWHRKMQERVEALCRSPFRISQESA